MGLSINQNIAAFNAYRNLSVTQGDLSKSLEKLSSGYRINRAADDAAGLAISEGLRSQVGGLKQASRNAQDGISVVQTAEGALTETTAILQRMRTLSVQASSSGSLNADARGNIQLEVSELKSELTRIADTTQYNGTKLLDGAYAGKFQVGANVGEAINVGVSTAMSAAGLGVGAVDVAAGGPEWTSVPGSLNFASATALTLTVNPDASGARTLDLTGWDTTATSAAAARNQALVQSAYDRALTGTGYTVKVDSFGGFKANGPAGSVATDLVFGGAGTTSFNGTAGSGADAAISAIDAAIKTVSTVRADLGAKQNRLDHTIKNLNVAVENLSASESRIRDTDMASEMTNFTRSQILSQAGTAMLAQANQIPQGVLSLLR